MNVFSPVITKTGAEIKLGGRALCIPRKLNCNITIGSASFDLFPHQPRLSRWIALRTRKPELPLIVIIPLNLAVVVAARHCIDPWMGRQWRMRRSFRWCHLCSGLCTFGWWRNCALPGQVSFISALEALHFFLWGAYVNDSGHLQWRRFAGASSVPSWCRLGIRHCAALSVRGISLCKWWMLLVYDRLQRGLLFIKAPDFIQLVEQGLWREKKRVWKIAQGVLCRSSYQEALRNPWVVSKFLLTR